LRTFTVSCICRPLLPASCCSEHIEIFFFFSSRRRHTRSTRDWSSDVCSSDLDECDFGGGTSSHSSRLIHGGIRYLEQLDFGLVRSEERRVGKECRSRWWP